MRRDFSIASGIYLIQHPHELDLHNDFDFTGLHYSIDERTLLLCWRRSLGEWVSSSVPPAVSIEFREVSEFRFFPRDERLPFTEDDCVSSFGYWTDEEWAHGVIVTEPSQTPDPSWLTGISFMSGAVIAVQAASAYVQIEV